MGSPLSPSSPVRLSPSLRFLIPIVLLLIVLHFILGLTQADYTRVSPLKTLSSSSWRNGEDRPTTQELLDMLAESIDRDNLTLSDAEPRRRANAVLVMLARNSEINDAVSSIRQLEDRFNHEYHYPWVFLNDEPFSEDFIRRTSLLTNGNATYGVIPSEHWNQPDWIDENRARNGRNRLILQNVIYGGSVSYRNMCRFNSGFFYRHELLVPYRYYWRVEPGVKYFCDVDYDPFLMMQDEGKVYGFTISLTEWEQTIPTLWSTVKEFIADHPEYVANDNAMGFLSDNGGDTYNLCHFWSNFEIADMDFWRGEAYSAFFEYLESKGGFYYERWGDAPVHSIGAALFARTDQIHAFKDIGYRHDPFQHCPQGGLHARGKCWCDPSDTFDYVPASCMRRWEKLSGE